MPIIVLNNNNSDSNRKMQVYEFVLLKQLVFFNVLLQMIFIINIKTNNYRLQLDVIYSWGCRMADNVHCNRLSH